MWFFKKKIKHDIFSPIDGEAFDISEAKDGMFSEYMLGKGMLIKPTPKNTIRYNSPIDGEVVATSFTKNVYGIRTPDGLPVLLHIGLDVKPENASCFMTYVSVGNKVKKGGALVEVRMKELIEKGGSPDALLVITNSKNIENQKFGEVKVGDKLFNIK